MKFSKIAALSLSLPPNPGVGPSSARHIFKKAGQKKYLLLISSAYMSGKQIGQTRTKRTSPR
jgi:hypothetical protein